jgi:hypothetical protein
VPGEASLIFFIAACVSHAKAAQENESRAAPMIALKNGIEQEWFLIVGKHSVRRDKVIASPEAKAELERLTPPQIVYASAV